MKIKSAQRAVTATKTARPLLLTLLILGIATAILVPFYLARNIVQRGMGGSSSETEAQFADTTPGSPVKLVLEVTSKPMGNLMKGTFLQRKADGSYARTTRSVSVKWHPERAVVMGSTQDVYQGAVLQISGRVDIDGSIHADQIVVLTNVVTIH